jgi:bifunctional non-homologous end joining protein LigD
VGLSYVSDETAAQMVNFVRSHGLEGDVAKKADSVYQPGLRTGVWTKTRINLGHEFVIGGYIPSHLGVDSIVVGFYKGKDLYYAARVRAGFVPTSRRQVFDAIKHLKTAKCPFVNLPEKEPGRWGEGFTAEKMKETVWLLCRIRHSAATMSNAGLCRIACCERCHHCLDGHFVPHSQTENSGASAPESS